MQKKTGVSLIVLVITVIVMVILAGTIILTINNTGIMGKAQSAVDEANLKEIQTLAELKWSEAFLDGNTTQESLEREVLARMQEEQINLSKYVITVTDEGVEVETKNWIVATVDGVPIPKGFVASSATGENTKTGGLVIYEGVEAVTDENVETAKRTRNQYVWVPVPKEDFTTKFIRYNFSNSDVIISNVLGKDYWEVVLDETTNVPFEKQDINYVSEQTLREVQAMYESVKEYEGFYIARYEAGINTQRMDVDTILEKGVSVYSIMGAIPYNNISWGTTTKNETNGAVEVARSIYPETNKNYGAVSTLIYGVQWDRTLAWWLETNAKDGKGNIISSLTDSTNYGNHFNSTIVAEDLNDGARYALFTGSNMSSYQIITASSTKESGTYWALTTGALKVAKINNIYDMAGNMFERTMEGGNLADYRVRRGGAFYSSGYKTSVSSRVGYYPDGGNDNIGFRACLYIKK